MSNRITHRKLVASEERCKCCGALSKLFGVIDFSKSCEDWRREPLPLTGIPIFYHRCTSCGFIFTVHFDDFTPTDFMREVYNDDYIKVDPGYVEQRPKDCTDLIIQLFGNSKDAITILDYGSGNGRMAETLKVKGFFVQNYDPFSPENSRISNNKFDLVTCFEVLEHTSNPLLTCETMQNFVGESGMILFSTRVQPSTIETQKLSWWYIGPRNGHISIYTKQGLKFLWSELGFHFDSFNDGLHVAFRHIPEFCKHIVKP